jgi:hypothetical protein
VSFLCFWLVEVLLSVSNSDSGYQVCFILGEELLRFLVALRCFKIIDVDETTTAKPALPAAKTQAFSALSPPSPTFWQPWPRAPNGNPSWNRLVVTTQPRLNVRRPSFRLQGRPNPPRRNIQREERPVVDITLATGERSPQSHPKTEPKEFRTQGTSLSASTTTSPAD